MTRTQRRRKHERAVAHQRQQRARLRTALAELPAVLSSAEMTKRMEERGYERDWKTGKWRRAGRIPPRRRPYMSKRKRAKHAAIQVTS